MVVRQILKQELELQPYKMLLGDQWFLPFMDKDRWSPNNPYLKPLNYCMQDELMQQMK